MAIIKTKKGIELIVDDDRFEELSRYTWHFNHKGYAYTSISDKDYYKEHKKVKNKNIMMHRLINETPKGMYTDHINGNKHDNRKCNLRTVTAAENNYNKHHSTGKSKYRGVTFDKRAGKWLASVYKGGKQFHGGYYVNEVDAAKGRDKLALKLHGEHASLNFPVND